MMFDYFRSATSFTAIQVRVIYVQHAVPMSRFIGLMKVYFLIVLYI